jgi:hypothetical protein
LPAMYTTRHLRNNREEEIASMRHPLTFLPVLLP